MNKEIFSDAMNEIDPKYVEEALTYKPAKRLTFPVWVRRCAAACLICVLGLGVVLLIVSLTVTIKFGRFYNPFI